jgi:hypothetical protein
LTSVNRSLTKGQPLTGITEASVLEWRDSLAAQHRAADTEKISNLVIEIAKRVSMDSDCSRDVFEEDELVPVNSVGELLKSLQETVERISRKDV